MKFINKYLAFAAILALLFSSCSKDENTVPIDDPSVQSVDLTFGALLNDLNNRAAEVNKSHFDEIPDCSGADPDYVELEISYPGQAPEDMGVITVDILSENGDFFTDYTEDLKIPVPDGGEVDVTLKSFVVFDSEGNRIWIAPIAPEDNPDLYEGYVDKPLEFEFSVQDGTKPYIDVEVLCYDRRMANEYGYVFFDVVPEVIYPYCLFINYCDEDGRHFVANYSVDLYYGPDDTGIQLYDGISLDDVDDADYGIVAGNYYSDPLCLIVPGKPMSLADNAPYLFLVIYPNDWDDNYGDIDNSLVGVPLSWNDVNGLLNDDGTTNEYDHILIGECEGALSGDGSGGNGGGTECDPANPLADCDDDDLRNECDPDSLNFATFDCDGDGVLNGDENPGCVNNDNLNCGVTTEPLACELSIPGPDGDCIRAVTPGSSDLPFDYADNGEFLMITADDDNLPIPLLEDQGGSYGASAGNFVPSISGTDFSFSVSPGADLAITDYLVEIKDSENGDVSCVTSGETITGSFSYPVYIRVITNVCADI